MNKQILEWYYENENLFSEDGSKVVREALEYGENQDFNKLMKIKLKNPNKTLILAITLGLFGIDRFYLRSFPLGIVKMMTIGGCGIMWLYDVIYARKYAMRYNLQKVMEILPIENGQAIIQNDFLKTYDKLQNIGGATIDVLDRIDKNM